MSCNSKQCINVVTLIIAVIVFIQTNFLTIMLLNLKDNKENLISKIAYEEQKMEEKNTNEEWKLIIPKIDVSADIKEGTDGVIINNNIGHFTETPYEDGNIGLIAASAGYKENYFSRLHELQKGDIIKYIKGEIKKEYVVESNNVIEQTDWSYLSSTQDNRITLITGILEQPEKRRCVQAKQINQEVNHEK